jgi:spore maturation protein SpmA
MALSRIWSAFVIIAITVAAFHWLVQGNEVIFNRMVVGKADDSYPYVLTGYDNDTAIAAQTAFVNSIKPYGFVKKDSAKDFRYIITNDTSSDTVKALKKLAPDASVYTYNYVRTVGMKPVDGIIETCKSAVNISIGLIGIMALFIGFMSIAERAGGIRVLSRIIGPFFSRLFPGVPKDHPANGHMMMNFSANLLGLDNAATPFGLKAMDSLQELNPNKETATDAQIMFLCLHASGLTLIPVSIIAVRAALKASNPTDIFIPCMIATFVATMAAMFLVSGDPAPIAGDTLVNINVNLEAGKKYSIFLVDTLPNLKALVVSDNIPIAAVDNYSLRFINLTGNPLDTFDVFSRRAGNLIFTGVKYKDINGFIQLPVPTIQDTFDFRKPNTTTTLFSTNLQPISQRAYTLFTRGKNGLTGKTTSATFYTNR